MSLVFCLFAFGTLQGIFVLNTLIPATGAFVAAFITWKFYKLPESSVQQMIDEQEFESSLT